MYILRKYQTANGSKIHLLHISSSLDDDLLFNLFTKIFKLKKIRYFARIKDSDIDILDSKLFKSSVTKVEDEITPEFFLPISYWGLLNTIDIPISDLPDDIKGFVFTSTLKDEFKVQLTNLASDDIDLLFSFWREKYSETQGLTLNKKQKYKSYLDSIKVLEYIDYRNLSLIHNIVK